MTRLPLKKYKREFDFSISMMIAIGMMFFILIKVVMGHAINKQLMLPMFACIVMLAVLFMIPSPINKGKKVMEQILVFYKYLYVKVKEEVLKR